MAIPTQHNALLLPSVGADLAIQTVDAHTPDAGEILVRIEIAAINPLDWMMQEFGLYLTQFPAILGCDACGTIVQVGLDVTSRSVGERVAFPAMGGNRGAAFQQFAVVEAAHTFKIPPHTSFDDIAPFAANLITAVHGLYGGYIPSLDRGGAGLVPFWKEGGAVKYVGQTIVVMGGASANGQYAIQLSRLSNFTTIITTASAHNEDFLLHLGATHVIDRRLNPAELVAHVQKITDDPIHVVYDSIGEKDTQNIAFDLVEDGGTLLVALPSVVEPTKLANSPSKKVYMISGPMGLPGYETLDSELFDVLSPLIGSGDLKCLVPEHLTGGLAAASEGFRRLKNNEVSARKLVIRPYESM